MNLFISLTSDFILLIFNLSLYVKLTQLKKEDTLHRALMYAGSALIITCYAVTAYVFKVPCTIASFFCMSIPSFFLFLYLAKYRGFRFIVTFCFADTLTYILAFCVKGIAILGGFKGEVISLIFLIIFCIGAYAFLEPYCSRYRELMEHVTDGWNMMAVSALLIYILLSFAAAYPAPLINRTEYFPVYFFMCMTILSFYCVFLSLIIQKSKLNKMNILLQQQKYWQRLAYLDELTQLANPAAYRQRTTELEQRKSHTGSCYLLIFDIDDFKKFNDSYGHHTGNLILQSTAAFFFSEFSEKHYEFFRIGGDEFAAIVTDVSQKEILETVRKINTLSLDQELVCTYSCGYSEVDFSGEKPFETAFVKADKAMYTAKKKKKANC